MRSGVSLYGDVDCLIVVLIQPAGWPFAETR